VLDIAKKEAHADARGTRQPCRRQEYALARDTSGGPKKSAPQYNLNKNKPCGSDRKGSVDL
jgi:hypothetical protein